MTTGAAPRSRTGARLGIAAPVPADAAPARAHPRGLGAASRLATSKPLGAVSAVILLVMVLAAVFAPVVSPHDPYAQDATAQAAGPSVRYPMGTDHLGRDVLSRVIYGARVSLWVGIVSVGLGLFVGASLGLVSGYFKGRTDLLIQRAMDVVLAFPTLVLALALMAILGTSLTNVMFAVGIVMTPGVSRVVRSVVLSLREHPFVEAARCLGAGHARIILRHVLPNTLAPIIIWATVNLGNAILIEASLSFLGLGTQPPAASWGNMLAGQSRQYFETAPWMAVFPGIALSLTVLAFNLLGDALRDVLDPRLRK